MVSRAKVLGNPTHLPVIVLANLSHGYKGLQVFVGLVRVNVVEGAAVPWISI